MANVILPTGYEATVRTNMGVTTSILSDTEVQSQAPLAEALTKKAVPTYAAITTGDELVFLQNACVAQVCALLCSGMPNRIKISQTSETGFAFRLKETDWAAKKTEFENDVKDFIDLATGGVVVIPFSLVGVVTNDRIEIDESGDA